MTHTDLSIVDLCQRSAPMITDQEILALWDAGFERLVNEIAQRLSRRIPVPSGAKCAVHPFDFPQPVSVSAIDAVWSGSFRSQLVPSKKRKTREIIIRSECTFWPSSIVVSVKPNAFSIAKYEVRAADTDYDRGMLACCCLATQCFTGERHSFGFMYDNIQDDVAVRVSYQLVGKLTLDAQNTMIMSEEKPMSAVREALDFALCTVSSLSRGNIGRPYVRTSFELLSQHLASAFSSMAVKKLDNA